MAGQSRAPGAADTANLWLASMPAVFVLIWSTGFIVARYGMPHAPPLGFLALRFALSLLCLGAWVALSGATWPQGRSQWVHLGVAGVFMHAGYLGGVWTAVKFGIGAGTVALIVGLQPLLTAVWVSWRGERSRSATPSARHVRLGIRQWFGLLLGLVGLTLVVERKLAQGEVSAFSLTLALLALASITAGTLYQKRHVQSCDVRTANFVQLLAALVVVLPLAAMEPGQLDWHPEMIGALAWSVIVLTLGGSSLLYLLIQHGAATRVTSLMYLVPPCTAVLAWLLFGEAFGASVMAGIVLTVAGVALVVRSSG